MPQSLKSPQQTPSIETRAPMRFVGTDGLFGAPSSVHMVATIAGPTGDDHPNWRTGRRVGPAYGVTNSVIRVAPTATGGRRFTADTTRKQPSGPPIAHGLPLPTMPNFRY